MTPFDRRYGVWAALLATVLAAPIFAGFSQAGWEAAQVAGLCGAVACIVLCGASIRPRDSAPSKLVSVRLHSLIGWAAMLGTALHVAGVLLADRTTFEYLRPSMPGFQLAGIAAGLLLLVVTLSAIAAVRRGLWKSHRGFQATHVVLSCLLLLALTMHVVTTDRYAGGGVRRALYLAAVIGAVLLLLRPRLKQSGPAVDGPIPGGWRRRLVFGRNATWVIAVIVTTVVVSSALLSGKARGALRAPLVARTEPLALDFPHGKHVQVNCLICHHNFADGTGMENCILCHKSERSDLQQGVQARFHGFCLECHRRPQTVMHGRGPVSECKECHRSPTAAHP